MKKIIITFIVCAITGSGLLLSSCAPTKDIADKGGAQLWGENCSRCHNAPTMDQYAKEDWGIIGTHMKLKAGLTAQETKKVVEYLQSGN
ncbi:MAG: cytochrome c [Bacteroidetes bacterium]|nr:cytochrome c [Bacteroidota bacterium]